MPNRIFLDTNVYIVGAADIESIEWKILTWLGFDSGQPAKAEVVVSAELIEQILRVAKRVKSKDWAGSIVRRIWQNLNLFISSNHGLIRAVVTETQEFECFTPEKFAQPYLS